jgi:hypothetical protein
MPFDYKFDPVFVTIRDTTVSSEFNMHCSRVNLKGAMRNKEELHSFLLIV